jgi:hypothetical protein
MHNKEAALRSSFSPVQTTASAPLTMGCRIVSYNAPTDRILSPPQNMRRLQDMGGGLPLSPVGYVSNWLQ